MNKKTIQLGILIFLLILAIAAFLVIKTQLSDNGDANEDLPKSGNIIFDAGIRGVQVTSVEYRSAAIAYEVGRGSQGYYLVGRETFPLDQNFGGYVFSFAEKLVYERDISDQLSPTDEVCGLAEPAYTLTFHYADASPIVLQIGAQNPHTGTYYATLGGTSRLLMVNGDFASTFAETDDEMIALNSQITPVEGLSAVTDILVEKPNGTGYSFHKIKGTFTYDVQGEPVESVADRWEKRDSSGHRIAEDATDEATALYDTYASLKLTEWFDDHLTEGEKEDYHLASPEIRLTFVYEESDVVGDQAEMVEKRASVSFGALHAASEDDKRFACLSSGNIGYLVSESLFPSLFSAE